MKLLMTILLFSTFTFAQQGDLVRAEPLTPADQDARAKAYDALVKAQANVHEVEYKIAQSHHMKNEEYMEWRTHYEFDGGFIVLRRSGMINSTIEFATDINNAGPVPPAGGGVIYTPQPSGDLRADGFEPKRIIWRNSNNTGDCSVEIK